MYNSLNRCKKVVVYGMVLSPLPAAAAAGSQFV